MEKAEEQKKMTEDNNIDTVPTVFINGKKVKDPYEVEESGNTYSYELKVL